MFFVLTLYSFPDMHQEANQGVVQGVAQAVTKEEVIKNGFIVNTIIKTTYYKGRQTINANILFGGCVLRQITGARFELTTSSLTCSTNYELHSENNNSLTNVLTNHSFTDIAMPLRTNFFV